MYGNARAARAQEENARRQDEYNAAISRNNAQLLEYRAQDEIRKGEDDAIALRRRGDQIKSEQRVQFAARGVDVNEGSAQDAQNETDFFSETDQATARLNAQRNAWATRIQRDDLLREADFYTSSARSRNPRGAYRRSLLTDAPKVASAWYSASKGG
jgi:hypothetical protein